jgi:hypothetical protein
MTSHTTDFVLRTGVREAMPGVHRMIVPTDDRDAELAHARAAALELASRFDVELVLYDRTGERWTDTPHPKGPLRLLDLDADEHPHLVEQLRECAAAGVDAVAYLSTVPALTAMVDALQAMEIDCIVLPRNLQHPKLMDRLEPGAHPAQMVQRVSELQLDRSPVMLVVGDDNVIDVAPPRRYPT